MQNNRMVMGKKWMVWAPVIVALVLAVVLAPAGRAGKFHFNSVTFDLGSLVMNGDLVGLGNDVAEVTLTGYGTVKAICQNKGGQQAPGRNPIRMNVQQTNKYVTDSNGRALVQVIAEDPALSHFNPSPSSKQAGCPNGNWQVVGIQEGSTDWTAANILVKDILGQEQLNLSYTCTTTFTNGVGTSVKCVES